MFPRDLKLARKNVSEWLGVGVRVCLLQKAAMEADAVKALDSDGDSLVKKSCLSRFASTSCETVTKLIEKRNALCIDWTESLEC